MAEALLTLRLDYADHLEEDPEMVTLLRHALALLPHGDSAIRARLEGFLAQEAFSTMPDPERRTTVRRALAMARRVGDPVALASVLTSHCWIVAGPESLPERLAIADELVAVGRAADLPYAECDGQQWRFLAHVERGEVDAADAALAAARRRREPQSPSGRSASSTRRGRCSPVAWPTPRPQPREAAARHRRPWPPQR